MVHALSIRFAAVSLLLSIATLVRAQEGRTKEGFSLTWDKKITVLPDSISNGKHRLPAWTIAVFETDAGTVLDLWKNDMKTMSTALINGKPAYATGVRIAEVGEANTMFAGATTDKKAKLARLTVAFATSDSTGTPNTSAQEAYVRSLAVKYNRAVVQTQIATYDKMLGKAGDKLSGTQEDVAKNRQNITKANGKLEKIKAKRGKVQGEIAHQQGDIAGLEKKFALTNATKDLEKLTKARGKLAKSESALAKLMQQEADVQGDIAKYQGKLESSTSEAEGRTATKDEVQRTVDALKRKHDNIN